MKPDLPEVSPDPALKAYIDRLVAEQVQTALRPIEAQLDFVAQQLKKIQAHSPQDKVSIVVSSHELDKLMPAFIIANGAASFGMQVEMFFTLWGIVGLKKETKYEGKSVAEKMLTFMLPSGPQDTGISRMNMLGAGAFMMRGIMKTNHVASLDELIQSAIDMGVRLTACQMTMGMMGITRQELRDDIAYGGVASYIEAASESKITLFI